MKKDSEIKSSAHSKYRCQYHIVFAPKYRRKAIYGEIKRDIGEILRKLCVQKGVEIIGISKDTVASHKKFEDKQGLTITILADPELTAIQAYDVWHEKKMAGNVYMGVVRTTYLIDENGIIIKANDKVKAAADPEKMLEEV